jgi:hypothetical protein
MSAISYYPDICTICQLPSENRRSQVLTCGHVLHKDCLSHMPNSDRCPTCRKPLTDDDRTTTNDRSRFSNHCVVCLNGVGKLDANTRQLSCSHTFHTPCIDDWLRNHTKQCPQCQTEEHPPRALRSRSLRIVPPSRSPRAPRSFYGSYESNSPRTPRNRSPRESIQREDFTPPSALLSPRTPSLREVARERHSRRANQANEKFLVFLFLASAVAIFAYRYFTS